MTIGQGIGVAGLFIGMAICVATGHEDGAAGLAVIYGIGWFGTFFLGLSRLDDTETRGKTQNSAAKSTTNDTALR